MNIDIERQDAILRLRKEGMSYEKICKTLNCSKSLVSFYCNPNRIDDLEKDKMKEKQKREYEELVCNLSNDCENISQICKLLGKRPTNTNIRGIRDILDKNGVDITRFVINYGNKKSHKKYDFEEVFCADSKYKTVSRLKDMLINKGIKERKCECCGNSEWIGHPISLQVHHVNGDNTDNRIENLQLLCPNCHSFTDNYCGKNRKTSLINVIKTTKTCKFCGKEFIGERQFCSDLCKQEFNKSRYKMYSNEIDKDKLLNAFIEHKSFSSVGKYFGVSDKAVAKWCKKFGLPFTAKDMKQYINKSITENVVIG